MMKAAIVYLAVADTDHVHECRLKPHRKAPSYAATRFTMAERCP